MAYNWYRFKTRADDIRPLKDMKDIGCPWWCTGGDMDGEYSIIVCYLPSDKSLYDYWDDAYDVDYEEREKIIYTERFRKPEWLED